MIARTALAVVLAGIVATLSAGQQDASAFGDLDKVAVLSVSRDRISFQHLESIQIGNFPDQIEIARASRKALKFPNVIIGKQNCCPTLAGAKVGIPMPFRILDARLVTFEREAHVASVRDPMCGSLSKIFEPDFECRRLGSADRAVNIHLFDVNVCPQLMAAGQDCAFSGLSSGFRSRISLLQGPILIGRDHDQAEREKSNEPIWVSPYRFFYRYGLAAVLGVLLGFLICRSIDRWG